MSYSSTMQSDKNESIYKANEKKANRDPLTGEPGSHPVATGLGAAVGAAAGVTGAIAMGALTGAPLGPVGAIAGAAAGGILGGGVGHGIGEDIYPTQLVWWEENYDSRPYVKQGLDFEEYRPAYWYGIDAAVKSDGRHFDTIEAELGRNWQEVRGRSALDWNDALPATRDAYERLFSK